MGTAVVTKPVVTEHNIDQLDYTPTCHCYSRSTDQHCGEPAVALVEMHRVNYCTDPECNGRGNMEGNVCQGHLDHFIELAVELSKELDGCPSCTMPITKASDILQKVIRL